jgi:hypothetical protein
MPDSHALRTLTALVERHGTTLKEELLLRLPPDLAAATRSVGFDWADGELVPFLTLHGGRVDLRAMDLPGLLDRFPDVVIP